VFVRQLQDMQEIVFMTGGSPVTLVKESHCRK